MLNIELNTKQKTELSEFKDPFKKDSVKSITFWIRVPIFETEFTFESTIEFQKGNTQGKQNLKGSDLPDIINKTKEFIDSL